MKTTGKHILFLGDSITQGVGASRYENCYVRLVTKDGGFVEGLNFGVGGTRIAPQRQEKNQAWAEDFLARLSRMPDRPMDYVLVFGGTNDYGHGDAPIGRLGDKTTETFYGAFDKLLSSLKAKYAAANLIVLTPIHRKQEHRYVNEMGVRNCGCLGDYVAAEKEVAKAHGVPVLDLYEESGIYPDDEENNKQYTVDGLHPNDLGHRMLADKILAYLNKE